MDSFRDVLDRRALPVLLGCLLALGYFLRLPRNPNENSRMSPVLAAFWHRTLRIDAYQEAGPLRTIDRSVREGHYYSDKAPGSSLLAAVGYAPLYAFEQLTGREASYLARKFAMTLSAVTIPVALALSALFSMASAAVGPRRGAAAVTAGLLGTPLLPFGSVLFGHALAGALLFLAFALVRRAALGGQRPAWRDLVGVGALLGLCAATEYTTVPACLLVCAYGLVVLRRRGELGRLRTWAGPLLGSLPFGLLLGLYSWRCFGSPWSLGYENLADPAFRSLHARGLVGITWPRPVVAYYLTVHPARGLLASAPILLLSVLGGWAMCRRSEWRAEAILCGAVFLSLLAINAGFGMWWGGFSYTARHLLPAVPFLVLPLAFLPGRWAVAAVPLFLVSALQSLCAAFGDPLISDAPLLAALGAAQRGDGLLPWHGTWAFTHGVWAALRGREGAGFSGFAPNAAGLLGLHGPVSALPLLSSVAALFGWAALRPGGPRLPSRGAPARPLGA